MKFRYFLWRGKAVVSVVSFKKMQKLLDKYYLELVKIPSHNEVSSGDEDSDYGPEEEKIMYLDVSIVVEDD